jgi:Nucleotide-diphospho-sugar transferase
MKLYTLYGFSNEVLLKEWFLPTLKDDLEIVKAKSKIDEFQEALYGSLEFNRICSEKVDCIIEAIKDNWNKIFIYADPDIQFFKSFSKDIEKRMKTKDIIFQMNSPKGDCCAGFFACRGNQRVLALWEGVREYMLSHPNKHDQDAINTLLFARRGFIARALNYVKNIIEHWELFSKNVDNLETLIKIFSFNLYNVKWSRLPARYYCPGMFTGKKWHPGQELPVVKRMVMHHANWVVGLQSKIKQLEYVREAIGR